MDKKLVTINHENIHLRNQNHLSSKAIEKLTEQKTSLTQKLLQEIKRNGLLTKSNNELKETINLQRNILLSNKEENTDQIKKELLEATISNENSQSQSSSNFNVNNFPPVEESEKDNDTIVVEEKTWLSSIPLIGRYWGNKKTFKKTFEVIV